MLITVNFHSSLYSKTLVSKQDFDVDDIVSLCRGIRFTFPELAKHFNNILQGRVNDVIVLVNKNKVLLSEKDYYRNVITDEMTELWVVPSISGSGKVGKVFLGAALVAFAVFALPALAGTAGAGGGLLGGFEALTGFQAFLGKQLLGIGINLILGAIVSDSTPKPQDTAQTLDQPSRQNNNLFSGLGNTISTDTVIPLNYGLPRLAGHLVSGRIKVISHSKNEIISVAAYT